MSNQHRRTWLDPSLLERLAETAFLASECGLFEEAERIFEGLAVLRPANPSARIGLAMVWARRGASAQAIAELRTVVACHPGSAMAKAVLGTLLLNASEPGALALFQEVLSSTDDPSATELARSCLDLARNQEERRPAPSNESLEYFRHYNVRA